MRTAIDFPDETYRELKIQAAREGTTVRQVVLEGVAMRLRSESVAAKRFEVPVIHSKRPGTLHLTNEEIDELTAFS